MTRVGSKVSILQIIAVLGIIISACAAPAQSGASPTPGAAKQGGELKALLIVDSAGGFDPATMTEQTSWIIGDTLFDTLVEVEPSGKIVPSLAKSWEVSSDAMTYTFKLQTGVKFHNGREMTADDVKFSIDRIKDPATKAARRSNFDSVVSVTAPDATTVVLKLKEPFSPLLSALSHVTAAIVPKEEISRADFKTKPVGTGPFKLKEWVKDQQLTVERNPSYWRAGLPRLDRIVFTYNGDPNARVAAIRSGTVDWLYQAPSQLIDLIKGDSNLASYGGKGSLSFVYLGLNGKKAPYNDVRVRQAIFAALDRDAVTNAAMPGNATPLYGGFLPADYWAGAKGQPVKADYAKAKQLLTEAGYPNGFKMVISTFAAFDYEVRASQAIQQQLKGAGIEVEIKAGESGVVFSSVIAGNYEANVFAFSATFDPDDRVSQSFTTTGSTNWFGYSDPEVDRLAAQGRQILAEDKRAEVYRQLQTRVTESGPMAFLFTYYLYDVAQKYVQGYTWFGQFYYRSLRDVWLNK